MYEVDYIDDHVVVRMKGDLDIVNSSDFKKWIVDHLIASGRKNIVLDMTKLNYMDSSGLGVIISIQKHCKLNGGSLAIFGLNTQIRKLLELTSLDRILKIKDNLEEALKEE